MPARLRTEPNRQQKRRLELLPRAIGTMCPCGQAGCTTHPRGDARCDGFMTNPKRMDLDHTWAVALGGGATPGDRIICSPCNRSAGANLGNQLRVQPLLGQASRDW